MLACDPQTEPNPCFPKEGRKQCEHLVTPEVLFFLVCRKSQYMWGPVLGLFLPKLVFTFLRQKHKTQKICFL